MSRAQQDQFIDEDEEETCPLCVEEFDLTDKGFRPCPCGYQICQFCYNNVKNNMNGLCPACRRPYNDADIEYNPITPEEVAAHKARQAQKQKKTQAALQKEKQKAEAENLSRKHLAGLRVMQKNLVYVTGLTPHVHEDKLLQILRSDQYFGRYGEIIKIVVSKAKDTSHPQSVGVYVTYKRKEDAAQCIAAVDGSKNGDRILRAQFGTTKYCSAYLRGENCPNRNCMFLHEPGDSSESYSRAALSSFNAGQQSSDRGAPPQSQQPVASASQPMARQGSGERTESPATDRPALPSTASWASKLPQHASTRTESRSTSSTIESPAPVNSVPASQPSQSPAQDRAQPTTDTVPSQAPKTVTRRQRKPRPLSPFMLLLKNFTIDDMKIMFSMDSMPPLDIEIIDNYPPLFDTNGGAKKKLRRQREEEQRRLEQEQQALQLQTSADQDENAEMGGSLQLGGEPEERQSRSQPQSAIQPPGHDGFAGLDQRFQLGASPGLSDRGMTPQQQMLMQNRQTQGSYLNNPNQSSFGQQPSHPPGHQRNASRYSFANESSASTSVKPVANPKLLSQQSSILPPAGSNHFGAQHQQPHGPQFFTSNVQGPPPGLRTTGTPPVSGGMTFGQGHGFATGGIQYSAGATRNSNEEMMRNLLVGQRPTAAGGDQAKPDDTDFPPLGPPSRQQSLDLRHSDDFRTSSPTPPVPPGFEALQGLGKPSRTNSVTETRHSTPSVPPGLGKPPTAIPQDLDGGSRPSSRASLRRTASSQIQPALPLKPVTPSRTGTPTPAKQTAQVIARDGEVGTPTKAAKAAVAVPVEEQAVKGAEMPPSSVETKEVQVESSKPSAVATPVKAVAPAGVQPTPKAQAPVEKNEASAVPVTPTKPDVAKQDTQRRKAPGKLDIAAATQNEPTEAAATESTSQSKGHTSAAQTPVATSQPATPSLASPAIKSAPKTLRVVQTPKPETPPGATVSTPKEQVPPLPPISAARLPSRQPSVASINLPGTPSSEQVSVSDNISVTSTSQSRANSPPPPTGSGAGAGAGVGVSKVGSAPVRAKTKNQLKKERQERAKLLEAEKVEKAKVEEAAASKAAEEEVVAQEAIVSRKKKTKKEKEPKGKGRAAVPVQAKAESKMEETIGADTAKVFEEVEAELMKTPKTRSRAATVEDAQNAAAEASSSAKHTPTSPTKVQQRAKHSRTPSAASAQQVPGPAPHEPSPPPTPTLTNAQLLAEIKATEPAIQKCLDSLFRSPSSNHYKPNQPITAKDLTNPAMWEHNVELNLTKAEVEALLKGTSPSLHYGGHNGRIWDRGMVTSTGAHLRALTKELEARFLELEKMLKEMPDSTKFRPSKPQNELKFPSIDLESLKRGFENQTCGKGLSVMEQMVQDGSATKKGAFLVDEASKYINEFVMPPATPPPSAGGTGKFGAYGSGAMMGGTYGPYATSTGGISGGAVTGVGSGAPKPPQPQSVEQPVVSLEIAERQLNEAKRVVEEREGQLKKVMKKNRKVLGLG